MNPDRLAELEEERSFLLRSLADLDREFEAGDVDADDYRTLRDGYTVRAAEVLRTIEDGRAALPPRPRRNWLHRAAWVAVVAAVAVGAGLFVARSSGQRLPSQEMTGGIPGDVAGKLSQARAALAVDPLTAQQLYTDVLAERPNHPEALAYSGWLLALNSIGASEELREMALDTAKSSLRRSIAADERYADPHCFLAIIAANLEDDVDTAIAEFDACLANDPPADMRGLVEELVAGLIDQPPE
jgi:hypothetical protein